MNEIIEKILEKLALGLARVSTEEQEDGHTIPAQVQRINDYAAQKGLTLEKVFELTESSTKADRKKFCELFEIIKRSKIPVILIVETVDRLQRSFRESVELDALRKDGKLEIHFLRENLVINKDSNSVDIMRWDLAVFVAKTYVLQLSDNVKRSLEQKLRNGEWIGRARVGYLNIDLPNEKKSVVLDPDRAPLIKKAFEWYSTGNYSTSQITTMLKEAGLTNNTPKKAILNKSTVAEMLQEPFYYGEMRVKGKHYPHNYEPIVARWLFDKCQQVREGWHKKPFKTGETFYAFRGLIKHDCGCLLTPYTKKGIVYLKCSKYRGNCQGVSVNEKDLIKELAEIFRVMRPPDDVVEDVKQQLRSSHENEQRFYESNIQRINKGLATIKQRFQPAYEDMLDGRITRDEHDKLVQKWKQQERDLLLQLEDHSKGDEQFYITASYLLDISKRAQELFLRSQPEQKRQFLNFVLANLSLEGKKLGYKLKEPFAAMHEMGIRMNWLRRSDSNRQPTGYTNP
ncbi:recombinase family protein [Candidatus Peregrinibacteria bacterium]|nr:recombinase family protein [Candidatus Peregrinibacteria bacterium]